MGTFIFYRDPTKTEGQKQKFDCIQHIPFLKNGFPVDDLSARYMASSFSPSSTTPVFATTSNKEAKSRGIHENKLVLELVTKITKCLDIKQIKSCKI